jgi:mRNA (guanine-N7-)-methyltransferase
MAGVKHLVLVDIADKSVEDARVRYAQLHLGLEATFLVGDCWKKDGLAALPEDALFDVVSCQFALHYAFESEEKAEGAVHNIARLLAPGGYFIATFPDAEHIT